MRQYSKLDAATPEELRAIKSANRRNKARAAQAPLLDYAGLLEPITPAQRKEQIQGFQDDFQSRMAQAAARTEQQIAIMVEWLDDLDINAETLIAQSWLARHPHMGREYHADFLCAALATRTGETKLDIHNYINRIISQQETEA